MQNLAKLFLPELLANVEMASKIFLYIDNILNYSETMSERVSFLSGENHVKRKKTSRERPQLALYLKLKKRKVFKIVQEWTLWAL